MTSREARARVSAALALALILLLLLASVLNPLSAQAVRAEPSGTVSSQSVPSDASAPSNKTMPQYAITSQPIMLVLINATELSSDSDPLNITLDEILNATAPLIRCLIQIGFQLLWAYISPLPPPPGVTPIFPGTPQPQIVPVQPSTPAPMIEIPPEYRTVKPTDIKKITRELMEMQKHLIATPVEPMFHIEEFRKTGYLTADDLTAGEHVFGRSKYIIQGYDSEQWTIEASKYDEEKYTNDTRKWRINLRLAADELLGKGTYEKWVEEVKRLLDERGVTDKIEEVLRKYHYREKTLDEVIRKYVLRYSEREYDIKIKVWIKTRQEDIEVKAEVDGLAEVKGAVDLIRNFPHAIGEAIRDSIFRRLLGVAAERGEYLTLTTKTEEGVDTFKVNAENSDIKWVVNKGFKRYLEGSWQKQLEDLAGVLEKVLGELGIQSRFISPVANERYYTEITTKDTRTLDEYLKKPGVWISPLVTMLLLDKPRLTCFALNLSGATFVFMYVGSVEQVQQPSPSGEIVFRLPDGRTARCLYVGDRFICMDLSGAVIDPSNVVVHLMDGTAYLSMYPATQIKTAVYLLDTNDWGKAKQYITNYTLVFASYSIPSLYSDEVEQIVSKSTVVFVVEVDTQPYYGRSVAAWYPVFYAVQNPRACGYDNGAVIDPAFQQYLGTSVPALWDYQVSIYHKVAGTVNWAGTSACGWSYKKYSRGAIIEVPCDGFWKSADWLGKYVDAISSVLLNVSQPLRVIYMGGYTSDAPYYHKDYPLDSAWKALAQSRGWEVVDLRGDPLSAHVVSVAGLGNEAYSNSTRITNSTKT